MKKPRVGLTKSLQRRLTNQYLGIFTVVYFVLIVAILITTAVYNYAGIKAHTTDSVLKKLHNEEQIKKYETDYQDGYEQYIKSYASYKTVEFKNELIAGMGEMPDYDRLSPIRIGDGIRYFVRTGDAIFKIEGEGLTETELYIKFDLLQYSKDNVVVDEIVLQLLVEMVVYIIGVLFFLLIGNAKIKKSLQPIHNLTALTASINEKNLSERIDVESSRYELKELCITLNSMLDRIEKVYMKQKTFVSDVSHELRTPISVIDGYVNMLKRWGSSDKVVLDESIEAILSETKSMKELVEALLFLARYDNQTMTYESDKVDVSGLLEDVYRETMLLDKEIHIISFEGHNNLFCKGDYNKIKESIRVFVDNSLKYTHAGKKINLSCVEEEKQILVIIKDEGIGISKDHLSNIFSRFYRAESSRAKQTGGSGLGLPIARAIILAHHGKIRLTSKENKGTTIEIRLPKI